MINLYIQKNFQINHCVYRIYAEIKTTCENKNKNIFCKVSHIRCRLIELKLIYEKK